MSVHSLRPNTTADDTLRETAACWHDRIHRDKVSDETRAAFEQWLNERDEHRAAYESVASVWMLASNERHDPRILALRHETALRLTRKSSRWSFVSAGVAAAVVLVTAGLAVTIGTTLFLKSPLVSESEDHGVAQ